MPPALTVTDVYKAFRGVPALRGVSLEVLHGEIVAVMGPSGCGKSTVLNIVAGLETPDRGQVLWEGVSLQNVPPHRRGFGLMFQDFALFPHKNVFENVAFGLQMAGEASEVIRARVTEVLELVGLPGFGKRDVNTLSGGEQQRVALARSLAPRPRLLMLDEPLGSLDRSLRERLVLDLRRILKDSRQTAIYVTHDQEEAFALSDRSAVMNAGLVEQVGAPQEIYRHPATIFVARFLGMTNLIPGVVRREGAGWIVDTPVGRLPVMDAPSGEVTVLLRPDAVHLEEGGACRLEGKVTQTLFRGGMCEAQIEVNGFPLSFDFPSSEPVPAERESVHLYFDPHEALQVFLGREA